MRADAQGEGNGEIDKKKSKKGRRGKKRCSHFHLPVELRFAMQSESNTRLPGECASLCINHSFSPVWLQHLNWSCTIFFRIIDNQNELASHLKWRTGEISGTINVTKRKIEKKVRCIAKKRVSWQIKLIWCDRFYFANFSDIIFCDKQELFYLYYTRHLMKQKLFFWD